MFKTQLEILCDKLHLESDALKGVSLLVLPENMDDSDVDGFFDTDDSIALAKHFKSQGLACKTAYDFGSRPRILNRRGVDIWLGVLWVLDKLALPTFVNVLSAWITAKHIQSKPSGVQITSTEPQRIRLDLRLQDGDRMSSLKFDGSATDLIAVLQGLRSQSEQIDDRTSDG